MSTEIGLYYPFIEFKDDALLKLAVLYWDKLGRIVPSGYKPDDTDTVKRLAGELNFIKDFLPTDSEKEHVGNMFANLLDRWGEALARKYSLSLFSVPTHKPESHVNVALSATKFWSYSTELSKEKKLEEISRPAYIYASAKMDPQLVRGLVARGLAIHLEDDYTIGLHPKLAYTYMEALAEHMATERDLHPVTDDMFDHLAVSGYTLGRLVHAVLGHDINSHYSFSSAPTSHQIEEQMAMITLTSVIPQGITNVPIEKIVTLRKKHRDELTAFQTYLHQFVASLRNYQRFKDMDTLKAHLEAEYEKGLKQELENLKKCLRGQGMDTVEGAMNVRVALPPLVTSETTYLNQAHAVSVNPILAGAGALAFSLLPVIRNRRRMAKAAMHTSPAAFLFYTEEGVKPTTLASRITQSAREFFLGV